jgi:hypothetical protein
MEINFEIFFLSSFLPLIAKQFKYKMIMENHDNNSSRYVKALSCSYESSKDLNQSQHMRKSFRLDEKREMESHAAL